METNKPTAAIILSDPDYGLTDRYVSLFSSAGWSAKIKKPGDSIKNDSIVIVGFDLAAVNPGLTENIHTNKLAVDFGYRKEYRADMGAHPFHYLDSVTIIIHDYETMALIKEKIRPMDSRIIMAPYPCSTGKPASMTEGDRVIYSVGEFKNHPWFDGLDVVSLDHDFPEQVTYGSFVVLPEYEPSVWSILKWSALTGLPVVAPGIPTFQRVLFHSALLFDPGSKTDFTLKVGMLRRPDPVDVARAKQTIAVVVPRYAKDAGGGAEKQAEQMAKSMAKAGHVVEILTTRSDNMSQWNNNLPDGEVAEEGVTIRRFTLDSCDPSRHHELGHAINMRDDLSWTQETEWIASSIRSTALDEYIAKEADRFDRLFFIPYLYGTTYWASQMAPEKSFLIPCYHDEQVAFLRVLKQNAQWMAGVCFNTVAERRLAEKTLKIHNPAVFVTGEGVPIDQKGDVDRFRAKYKIDGDFILYVGRFQPEKNLPGLIEDFRKYVNESGSNVSLVLVGKGDMRLRDDPEGNIKVLGFLPERDKTDAYKACLGFVLPSTKESFSIVMMEAWLMGRPVIANARCNVAREHIFSCHGGFLYRGGDELSTVIETINNDRKLANELGARGREYVLENFRWETIVKKMIENLNSTKIEPLWSRLGSAGKACAVNLDMGGENRFARWIESMEGAGARISLSPEPTLAELAEALEENADIKTKYREFSHRAMFGQALSRLRGALTRHLRKNYLEQFESKQYIYNKETARLIRKLYDQIEKLR